MNDRKIAALIIVLAIGIAASTLYYSRNTTERGPAGGVASPPREFTEEEKKAVLDVPRPSASEEEVARHTELVTQLAQPSGALDVSNCELDPTVLKIKSAESLTFQNNGSSEVSLSVSSLTFLLAPGTTKVVGAGFERGPGIYGIGCFVSGTEPTPGGPDVSSGLIWVTN